MRLSRHCLTATLLLAPLTPPLAAQQVEFFPGGTYDAAVPRPDSVLGYALGTYHTDYAGLERWLAALSRSDRVKIIRYGESVERRPLYIIAVSSAANIARLSEVQAAMRALTDARVTTDAEAERIARDMPAVAWLNHGNDGNESAAFETAIQTSYQLAAGTDSITRLINDNLVTVIVPAMNPESHERFVAWYNAVQVGRAGTADHAAAEHNAPWGFNTNNNHYQIDLNRDAAFLTQQETRAIVRAFPDWNPVVFIDHHGQTKNMFFPPPVEAVNLNVTQNQRDWMTRYGEAIGQAFDRRGWSYYRGGRFDFFYSGYWDTWPTLNGAVGLTFETDGGGSKGLAWEREDGTVVTLRDGIAHHHTGSMAVLRVTAQDKARRLRDLWEYRKSAIAEVAREPMKQVVLLPNGDESRAAELARTLMAQRVEVYRATSPVRLTRAHDYIGGGVGARTVPAGAYVIPLAQPQKRLIKAHLEPDPAFRPEFLRGEEEKKRRAELVGRWSRDGFYDVTAWSLPLLFGVDAMWAEDVPAMGSLERVGAEPETRAAAGDGGATALAPARYGYLIGAENWSSMRVVARLLDEGFNLAVATKPFRVQGQEFARGTIIARVERNPETLRARLDALSGEAAVRVIPLNSAMVESGSDFGEDPVVELERPRIAILTEDPTDDRAYGAAWFTVEQRLGLPFTALKVEQLASADLGRYNVIVLPHGSPAEYQRELGPDGLARLERWARDGGTLVLIKGAAAMATRSGVEWTSSTLKRHRMPVRLFFEDSASGPARADSALVRDMDLVRTPGAILRLKVDPEHFLGFGYDRDVGVMIQSNYAFTISRDGSNVAAFPAENEVRIAGHVWPEARRALARSLYAWMEPMGRGQAIFFADDPNFRAAQLSTMRLFYNAVVLGPAFTR